MAGLTCAVCGLDRRSVKLTEVKTFDSKQRPTIITTCTHCKVEMLKGNHPVNQNIEQSGDGMIQGFVKPSNPDDKPAIRPS